MPGAVLLVTSNGAGLGHLSRMTAVAHELAGAGVEPVLASMSAALPLVTGGTGLRGEYLPEPKRGWVGLRRWQRYFAARVVALAREVHATAVVYDGVVPYDGLLAARARLPDVPFVWSRRGFWKPGTNARALRSRPAFDLAVEPGDLCGDADAGLTRGRDDAVRVPPISLAASAPLLDRGDARRRLGLDPGRPAALVTLGTSIRGDLGGPGDAAVRAVLRDPDWQVAVTRFPLGRTDTWAADAERVVPLVGVFPLVPLLAAFDAAVAAAGYNAVHELLPARVPTLLVAKHRGTDDQERRAGAAQERGWALAARDADPDGVATAVATLVEEGTRARLHGACADLPPVDGAVPAAAAIQQLASRPGRHHAGLPELAARAELRGRTVVAAGVRPERHATEAPRWSSDPAYADLLDDEPVEHLLRDASPAYVDRRRDIAARAYRAHLRSRGSRA